MPLWRSRKTQLKLPMKLREALVLEAKSVGRNFDDHIVEKLKGITPPADRIDGAKLQTGLLKLVGLLSRVPSIEVLSSQVEEDGYWWVKVNIDTDHKLAWTVVQNMGFVLNYISLSEQLPTVFKPVSPPPYLNGGTEFLSWVIEPTCNYIDPAWITNTLEGRLPDPVDSIDAWNEYDDENDV